MSQTSLSCLTWRSGEPAVAICAGFSSFPAKERCWVRTGRPDQFLGKWLEHYVLADEVFRVSVIGQTGCLTVRCQWSRRFFLEGRQFPA